MYRRLALVVIADVVAIGLAGCKSPDFCCTTTEACEESGVSKLTPCTNPDKPFCDNWGDYAASDGIARTCIPEPNPDAGLVDAGADADEGCDNSSECTEPTAPICSPERACEPCDDEGTGDVDCADKDSAAPRCADDGTCVECLGNDDCLSTSTTPVCDQPSHSCRACQAHAECASEVCNKATGACVATADIVYVDIDTGMDSGACGTQGSPCATIGGDQGGLDKVTVTRKWVKVQPGSYSEAVVINDKTVHVVANGADLSYATVGPPVVEVLGLSTVVIEGLRVHDGPGANGDGIRCSVDGGDSPDVILQDVRIENNTGQGIDANQCTLSVERSRIIGNTGGGISITSSDFSLVNTFIAKNGGASSVLGGVLVNQTPPSGAAGARFDFNTVSGNVANAGLSSGVLCSLVTTPLTFTNSIIYANQGVDGQVAGTNCTWTYSDIQDDVTGGTGNIDADPLFENVSTEDYHIGASSPARNAANPAATETVDIDGQTRPEGARSDMGADEVVE